jgi:hypothetical protein
MTVRQGSATESSSMLASGAPNTRDRALHSSWEEWFLHASPKQRAEALGLAQQQGVLYPHQLPAVSNGVKAAAAVKETAVSAVLGRLLSGKAETLPRLQLDNFTFFDNDLDELQRQAVRRALGTPDVFLLQGLPGTGKSRVLAEIVLQSAARGQRVLFLSVHAAALDVVLARLVGKPELFALRLLDGLEKPELLPAWLRGLTLEEQRQAFLQRMLSGARDNRERFEKNCKQRGEQAAIWNELVSCADQIQAIREARKRLDEELLTIAATVARDAEAIDSRMPFALRMRELSRVQQGAHRDAELSLQAQREALAKCDAQSSSLVTRLTALEPAYLAKKHGRFWSPAYWLNLFNGQIVPQVEALLEEQKILETNRTQIQQELDRLQKACTEQRACSEQQRLALIHEETNERRQVLTGELDRNEEQLRGLEQRWQHLCAQAGEKPLDAAHEAIAAAHELWSEEKNHDEQQCQFARQWVKFVEESGPQLAVRLPGLANLVAGTIQRWHADTKFRDSSGAPFDVVIIEDVDMLTDADLLKCSRHAHRCILVGHALAEPVPATEQVPRSILPTAGSAISAWTRLWQAVGGDTGRWPCSWRREQGRLICQLVPLTADDCQHLETEGLADVPDIELRILHRLRTTPRLAQVIFAAHQSFEEAFTFMVREVQEFPLEPIGCSAWWHESSACWRRCFGPVEIAAWIDVEPGVRVGAALTESNEAMKIACIEFDKRLWDRARAETWLYSHRPVHDQERTVFLQTPHRFTKPLARMVQSVVRANEWLQHRSSEIARQAFEFVAVPPLSKHDWPREGAGLEVDLAVGRQADRLPAGLRQGLAPRGFANYLEAQALLRRLETYAQKETNGHPLRVAVLALYTGQVELLRRLVEQSETLRGRSMPLEITLPSRMRQRECEVVLLSLTRSHSHRAVTFGDDIDELALGLTRASERVIVFGDPGTLSKRIHWHGPIDHHLAAASHQELVRLQRLVAFVHAQHEVLAPVNGTMLAKV